MASLLTGDMMLYITGVLAALLAALGLYTKGQSYKIKNLELEKKNVETEKAIAERKAERNVAKAKLHKEVAREVVKNNTIAKEKVQKIQEKIDEIKDGEEFTVTI